MTKGAIETGLAFAQALAAKDRDALLSVLAEDVDFRALTPNTAWREGSARGFVENVFAEWYGEGDLIEELVEFHARPITAARFNMSYRLHVRNTDGLHLIQQDAYFECVDGQIAWLRILCAGYLPV